MRGAHGDRLNPQLGGVAEQDAIGHAAPRLLGEDAGQQRADRAAHAVRRDDVEAVVKARAGAEHQAVVARNRRDAAQQDGADRADVAGRRSDGDQADDDARRRADCRDLAVAHQVQQRPHHQRRGRRQHGRRKRQRGDGRGAKRRTGVEAEPAEPEQSGAEERKRHVVRQERLTRVVLARAQHDRRHKGRDAGVDVHDGAAGKVERAPREEPAVRRPHPVADRAVDHQRPQRDEQQVGAEAHALDDGAGDQRGGDDREGALEAHEQHVRDRALGLEVHATEQRMVQPADERDRPAQTRVSSPAAPRARRRRPGRQSSSSSC